MYTFGSMLYEETTTDGHRAGRGMMHRGLMKVPLLGPMMLRIGMLPGSREIGSELCRRGFLVGCFPGGAREALTGHEHAYELQWGKRRGFAYVAKNGGVKIYPFFAKNVEEMGFNPIFWFFNLLKLGKIRDAIVKKFRFMDTIFAIGWVPLSLFCGIPIPVKVTYIFGNPIE